MISPSRIVAYWLIQKGLAGSLDSGEAWPVYMSRMPDAPDRQNECVSIRDTSGIMDGKYQGDGEQIEHPGIQIRLRSLLYPDGWEKMRKISTELDKVKMDVVNSGGEKNTLVAFRRTSNVIHLGSEVGTNRELFTFNGTVTVLAGV